MILALCLLMLLIGADARHTPTAGTEVSAVASPDSLVEDIWSPILRRYASSREQSEGGTLPGPRPVILVLYTDRGTKQPFRSAWLDSLRKQGLIDRTCSETSVVNCVRERTTTVLVLDDPVFRTQDSAQVNIDEWGLAPPSESFCVGGHASAVWSLARAASTWEVVGRRYTFGSTLARDACKHR